jgi:hypothetical protein
LKKQTDRGLWLLFSDCSTYPVGYNYVKHFILFV